LTLRIAGRFDVANGSTVRDIGRVLRNSYFVSTRRERNARGYKREQIGRYQHASIMHSQLPICVERTHRKISRPQAEDEDVALREERGQSRECHRRLSTQSFSAQTDAYVSPLLPIPDTTAHETTIVPGGASTNRGLSSLCVLELRGEVA
jgi:hypothetical protein